jgi:hypothetical protein
MIYVRILLVGVTGAFAAAFLWIVAAFVLPMFSPILFWRVFGRFTDRGAVSSGAVITSGSILFAAFVGFVLAAAWAFMRARAGLRSG